VDPALDAVTFEGTTVFCDEIGIQPDDIVLLALAHDLKSPRMGQWPRKEWIEGWRSYGYFRLFIEHRFI
jgi:DCN1-like protein 1/2